MAGRLTLERAQMPDVNVHFLARKIKCRDISGGQGRFTLLRAIPNRSLERKAL